jgi:hypothetical protein
MSHLPHLNDNNSAAKAFDEVAQKQKDQHKAILSHQAFVCFMIFGVLAFECWFFGYIAGFKKQPEFVPVSDHQKIDL